MSAVRYPGTTSIVAAALAVSLLVLPNRARAQADVDRFNRQLEQIQRQTILQIDQDLSLTQRAYFDYGGYAVVGYLSADDNVNDNHVLRQYQAYGYARFNPDGGANEFFLRGVWTWQNFNKDDAFNNHDDNNNQGDVDRWYYKFDLARYQQAYYGKQIDYDVSVKVGRDLQIWGNGLVLSEDVMGVDARLSWGKTDLTILAGLTPDNTTDIDTSRPDFDDDTQRGFYGLMLSHDFNGHKPYLYFLSQQDYNSENVSFTGPVKTTFDYNSWYIGLGSTGPVGDKIVYGVELAYEGGSALSNSVDVTTGLTPLPQVNEDIQAFGGDIRLDYLFSDERHTRLGGEVIAATGDDDRLISTTNTFGGNKAGTHDRAFNAFGLLNTGLAYAPAVSNLLAFRIGGSTFPLPASGPLRRMQVGTDIFIYNKFDKEAPVDEPSFDQRYLGWEPDLYLNWQITSDVTINVRYGVFFPSSDAFPSDDSRQYIYGGLTYAF